MRRLEETSDLIQGLLPEMLRKAGFYEVEETAKFMKHLALLLYLGHGNYQRFQRLTEVIDLALFSRLCLPLPL